jgi:transcriptional regulator with XRE-family HTH domain
MLRGLRQVSQKELARRTGVHHAQIGRYERNRRGIKPEDLDRLLAGLNVLWPSWEWTLRHAGWVDQLSAAEGSRPDERPWGLAASLTRSIEMHAGALRHLSRALPGGER